MDIKRNIILDLLPLYIAGEASEESRIIIEDFAKNDSEIKAMIQGGNLEINMDSGAVKTPDDLEMKSIKRVQDSIRRKMFIVAIVTATILLIPLIAMNFTDEVNWGILDFAVMGILIFSIGYLYVFLTKASKNLSYLLATAIALFTGFLLIWVNLAVGIIGESGHPANLLYFLVILIAVVFSFKAEFKAKEMSRAMFTTSLAQFLVPFIAMLFWIDSMTMNDSIYAVFIINSVITFCFVISALLFKNAK